MQGTFTKELEKAWHICQAFFVIVMTIALSSCGSVQSRIEGASELITQQGYIQTRLETSPFQLFTAYPPPDNSEIGATDQSVLTVVIEGDGLAWINRYTISDNPTPNNPVGLKLATALPGGAIYLARPCQYTWSDKCSSKFWTDKRFDKSVIDSYDEALNILKNRYKNQKFHLVGFSGGAYIAFALSAKRSDIIKLTSIAGVLDPDAWTKFHDISPLKLYDTQKELLENTRNVSFTHFCGSKDNIVPCDLTRLFINKAGTNHVLHEINGETHSSLWKPAVDKIRTE